MSHPHYNPHASASHGRYQGQYGRSDTPAERTQQRDFAASGHESRYSSSAGSSATPASSHSAGLPTLLTGSDGRVRNERLYLDRPVHQPLNQGTRYSSSQLDSGSSPYPTSSVPPRHRQSQGESASSSMDWLPRYKKSTNDDSVRSYSSPAPSDYSVGAGDRIPRLHDYDCREQNKAAAPPQVTGGKYSSESATSILLQFGLDKEDLEYLISFPEDQITPANLPFILRQIRAQKAKRLVTAAEPLPVSCDTGSASRSDTSSAVANPAKVINYGHGVQYCGGFELGGTSGSGMDFIQEEQRTSLYHGGFAPTDSYRPTTSGPVQGFQTQQDQTSESAVPSSGLPSKDRDRKVFTSENFKPVVSRAPEAEYPSVSKSKSPSPALDNVPPGRHGLVVMDKTYSNLRAEEKTQRQKPGVSELSQKMQKTMEEMLQKQPAAKRQPEAVPAQKHPVQSQLAKLRMQPSPPQKLKTQPAETSPAPTKKVQKLSAPTEKVPTERQPAESGKAQTEQAQNQPVAQMEKSTWSTVYPSVPPPYLAPSPMVYNQTPAQYGYSPWLMSTTGGQLPVLPSPVKMHDYAASTPRVFPHTCSLCQAWCSKLQDWILHQNSSLHLDNCKKLRAQHPRWNGEVIRDVVDSDDAQVRKSPSQSASPRRRRSRERRSWSPSSDSSRSRSRSYERTRQRGRWSPQRRRSSPRRDDRRSSPRRRERRRSSSASSRERRSSRRRRDERRSSPRRSRERRSSPKRRERRRSERRSSSRSSTERSSAERLMTKVLQDSEVQSLSNQSDLKTVVKTLFAQLAKIKTSSSSSARDGKSSASKKSSKSSSSSTTTSTKTDQQERKERSSSDTKDSQQKKIQDKKTSDSSDSKPQTTKSPKTATLKPQSKTSLAEKSRSGKQTDEKTAAKKSNSATQEEEETKAKSDSNISGSAEVVELEEMKVPEPTKVPQESTVTSKPESSSQDPETPADKATAARGVIDLTSEDSPAGVDAEKDNSEPMELGETAASEPMDVESFCEDKEELDCAVVEYIPPAPETQTEASTPSGSAEVVLENPVETARAQCWVSAPPGEGAVSQTTSSNQVFCPTIGEKLESVFDFTRIPLVKAQCLTPKRYTPKKTGAVFMITNLLEFRNGNYTEQDVANVFRPFGFQYTAESIYVIPQLTIAFLKMPSVESVHKLLQAKKPGLQGLQIHVVRDGFPMKPLEFYRAIMKRTSAKIHVAEDKTIFISNIPPNESKELRENLIKMGFLANFMPLLNKVFVAFSSPRGADRLGLWYGSRTWSPQVFRLGMPHGGFWSTLPSAPFLFPIVFPNFYIPKHATLRVEGDIKWITSADCKSSTIMLTGLPEGNFKHEDVAKLVWPHFTLQSLYYDIIVLTLQRRAFVHFSERSACVDFVHRHLAQPLFVRKFPLAVHFVLEEMPRQADEELMFRSMMNWSRTPLPDAEPLAERLLCVETSLTSTHIVKLVMSAVESAGKYLRFLPLANRICVEMAEPSGVSLAVAALRTFKPGNSLVKSWTHVTRFESWKSLKQRLRGSGDVIIDVCEGRPPVPPPVPPPRSRTLKEPIVFPRLRDFSADDLPTNLFNDFSRVLAQQQQKTREDERPSHVEEPETSEDVRTTAAEDKNEERGGKTDQREDGECSTTTLSSSEDTPKSSKELETTRRRNEPPGPMEEEDKMADSVQDETVGNKMVDSVQDETVGNKMVDSVQDETVGNKMVDSVQDETVGNKMVDSVQDGSVGNKMVDSVQDGSVGNKMLDSVQDETVGNKMADSVQDETVGNKMVDSVQDGSVGNKMVDSVQEETVGNKMADSVQDETVGNKMADSVQDGTVGNKMADSVQDGTIGDGRRRSTRGKKEAKPEAAPHQVLDSVEDKNQEPTITTRSTRGGRGRSPRNKEEEVAPPPTGGRGKRGRPKKEVKTTNQEEEEVKTTNQEEEEVKTTNQEEEVKTTNQEEEEVKTTNQEEEVKTTNQEEEEVKTTNKKEEMTTNKEEEEVKTREVETGPKEGTTPQENTVFVETTEEEEVGKKEEMEAQETSPGGEKETKSGEEEKKQRIDGVRQEEVKENIEDGEEEAGPVEEAGPMEGAGPVEGAGPMEGAGPVEAEDAGITAVEKEGKVEEGAQEPRPPSTEDQSVDSKRPETSANWEEADEPKEPEGRATPEKRKINDPTEEKMEEEEEEEAPRKRGRGRKRARRTPVRKSTRGKKVAAKKEEEEEEEEEEEGSEGPPADGSEVRVRTVLSAAAPSGGREEAETGLCDRRSERLGPEAKRSRSLSPSVSIHHKLPPFDPSVALGLDFLVPKMASFCRLCQVFCLDESDAREQHCRSHTHYHNLQKHSDGGGVGGGATDSSAFK